MRHADFKDAKILIVDDKQSNIDVLCQMLEYENYKNISFTTDSTKVESLLESFQPDLLLLDLIMPELSGFDILGTDSVVYEVDAFLNNNYVCVPLPDRVVPIEVRYGWTNNPQCSLFNEAGLPMAPFRVFVK